MRRAATYATILGSALAVLVVGLTIPAVFGQPDRAPAVVATTVPAPVHPADHDTRPAPEYVVPALPARGWSLPTSG